MEYHTQDYENKTNLIVGQISAKNKIENDYVFI